jgi:hypothetical protein
MHSIPVTRMDPRATFNSDDDRRTYALALLDEWSSFTRTENSARHVAELDDTRLAYYARHYAIHAKLANGYYDQHRTPRTDTPADDLLAARAQAELTSARDRYTPWEAELAARRLCGHQIAYGLPRSEWCERPITDQDSDFCAEHAAINTGETS